jgi:serine/threonine protein kinase
MHSTATTLVIGTPRYMPLEHIKGRAGPSADIYALGVTLIESDAAASEGVQQDAHREQSR